MFERWVKQVRKSYQYFYYPEITSEDKRRLILHISISQIGIFILLLFSIIALFQGNLVLGLADIVMATILLFNLIDIKRKRRIKANIVIGITLVSLFYIFLYATGGVGQSAFVWYFTYPLIACWLLGSKIGAIVSMLMVIPVILISFMDSELSFLVDYNRNMEIRFVASYMVIVFFAYIFERNGEKNRAELKSINAALEEMIKVRTDALVEQKRQLDSEIGERKIAESTVRMSKDSLKIIMDSIESIIYVTEKTDCTVLFMNQYLERILGKDVLGEPCWKGLMNQTEPCEACKYRKNRKQQSDWAAPLIWEGINPVTGLWSVNIERGFNWINGKEARLHIATDISHIQALKSEREDIESQLHRVQKMEALGTLAGGIAHDFNNILSVIIGYAEMVHENLEPNSENSVHIKHVLKASDRAKSMVDQILSFSRKNVPVKKPFDFRKTLLESIEFLKTVVPKHIRIDTEIPANSGTVFGDATQLNQVIMNLCTNASHAMKEKAGIMQIRLEKVDGDGLDDLSKLPKGRYFLLTVKDNGVGIPAGILDNIFEPYFTTKKEGEGSGMGLAVSYGIIKNHGGEITVSSAPGEGTEFQIFLPIHDVLADEEAESEIDDRFKGSGQRILFVDDEPQIAAVGRYMLERLGYRVSTFSNSQQASEEFISSPDYYDLVLTDMIMPEMTGVQLAESIRSIRTRVPIIICTGFSDVIDRGNFRRFGINALIMKPFNRSKLSETVYNVLNDPKSAAVPSES